MAAGLAHDRASCRQLFTDLFTHAIGPTDLVFCAHAHRLAAGPETVDVKLSSPDGPRPFAGRHEGAARTAPGKPARRQILPARRDGAIAVPSDAGVLGAGAAGGGAGSSRPLLSAWWRTSWKCRRTAPCRRTSIRWAASLTAAAVRLVPLGQTDGQRLLHELQPCCLELVQRYAHLTPDDAWNGAPGLDIRSMQHERLYSRLCRS